GHDGSTVGQNAFLRVVPAAGVAVALLTNGGEPVPVYREVVGRALAELTGIQVPVPPVPPAAPQPFDPDRYVGRYEADIVHYEVTADESGRLWVEMTPRGRLAEPRNGMHQPVAFVDVDSSGRARFLHQGRAIPRTSG